jgi:hypothetical protein
MALITPALSLTTVEVTEDNYTVTIDAIDEITLNNPTNVVTDTLLVGFLLTAINADGVEIDAVTGLTATNLQDALYQLAGRFYRQDAEPVGEDEGDLWYDTDDNAFKVYRHTSVNVIEWVTLASSDLPTDGSLVDSGSF